jgi:hypothetical protein
MIDNIIDDKNKVSIIYLLNNIDKYINILIIKTN